MDLRIFVEPQQGASYEQQLRVARAAETLGFDGFFRSDHYLKMGDVSGLPGPTDSWVTLGAIARETSRIRLGTLVCSATFRLPGPLAVAVAQVDRMSGGRVELGIGAGWFDDEHLAYGVPFPPLGERFDILEEQLQIVTGLWRAPVDGQFSFEGHHFTLVGSPALPKPLQPGGPPLIMGGYGARRTPRLAAAYASEFNVPFPPLEVFTDQVGRVRAACERIGRDPDDLRYSVALVVCAGENDEEVELRAGHIGRTVEDLKRNGAAGRPAEVLDKLATYFEAGAERIYLQVLDLDDLEHLHLLGEQVLRLLP
ncbi:MAG: LLM class F420-dependent oxidoreductase [Acidimicrobiales bacterium]|jgi:F420-dependent oxidoreductase-like protein|nr:LLM class F420-dependent oxidoreductase [Acidimicrobiales bacterium]